MESAIDCGDVISGISVIDGDISFSLAVLEFCYTSLDRPTDPPLPSHSAFGFGFLLPRSLSSRSAFPVAFFAPFKRGKVVLAAEEEREGGGFEGQFAGREYFHIVKILPDFSPLARLLDDDSIATLETSMMK